MTGEPYTKPAVKSLVSRTLHALSSRGVIRTLNFHSTPADQAERYASQLAGYRQHFRGVSEADLERSFTGNCWPYARDGLIVAFFNGYRNNYDVAAPLLERYGLRGWFFIPTGFIEVEPALQGAFAERSKIRVRAGEYQGGRVAMSWDELRELEARGHVIACHTRTHQHAGHLSAEDLHREVALSQQDFRTRLGHEVHAFAWLYGGEYGVNREADACLKASGYRYLFSNYKLRQLS